MVTSDTRIAGSTGLLDISAASPNMVATKAPITSESPREKSPILLIVALISLGLMIVVGVITFITRNREEKKPS
jgi:hypothetical protein